MSTKRAFFEAAAARTPPSPLLTYYAFLNLGKALIRCRGFAGSLDRATHGLSEGPEAPAANLTSGVVKIREGTSDRVSVFSELIERLGYSRPVPAVVPVPELAAQVVVGHRLWREASNRGERFVVIEQLEFINDSSAKQLWLRLWLRRSDLSRYGFTLSQLIEEGGLPGRVAAVDFRPLVADPDLVCLEQVAPSNYTGRPTDLVQELVNSSRPWLWRIVTAAPGDGYRRYYLHVTPATEAHRQPQLASMWMLMFFFGSVVRFENWQSRRTAGILGLARPAESELDSPPVHRRRTRRERCPLRLTRSGVARCEWQTHRRGIW